MSLDNVISNVRYFGNPCSRFKAEAVFSRDDLKEAYNSGWEFTDYGERLAQNAIYYNVAPTHPAVLLCNPPEAIEILVKLSR